MAEPTMVSYVTGTDDRAASPPPTPVGLTERPHGTATPIGMSQQVEAGHLESIRQQHCTRGIPKQTSELLLAGWSRGTNTAYQSGWK